MLPKLANIIAAVVTLAWAVNITVGFFWPDRKDPDLNTVFGLVVGAAMVAARRKKGEEEGDAEPNQLDQIRESVAGMIAPAEKSKGENEV